MKNLIKFCSIILLLNSTISCEPEPLASNQNENNSDLHNFRAEGEENIPIDDNKES